VERITISLDDDLVAQFEAFMARSGYRNRSEAVRDLIRDRLAAEGLASGKAGHCVGTLSYVYNHAERELPHRLTRAHHHHHDVAVSSLHVHLDHDNCLETVVVSGPVAQVEAFAHAITSEPGVRHGKLYLVPVEVHQERHAHGADPHRHRHISPRT
jgi:CopG family nickel-responsive transcriptional regulator